MPKVLIAPSGPPREPPPEPPTGPPREHEHFKATPRISQRVGLACMCALMAACSSTGAHKTASAGTGLSKPAQTGRGAFSGHSKPAIPAQMSLINSTYTKTIAQGSANLLAQLDLANGPILSASGPFQMLKGIGQLSVNYGKSQATSTLPTSTVLRFVNNSIYVQAGGIIASFDQNKPWAQLTHSVIQQLFCLLIPGATSSNSLILTSLNPIDFLRILNTKYMTATSIPALDHETNYKFYRVTINGKLANKTSSGTTKALFQLLTTGGQRTLHATIGLDQHGVTRYLASSFISGGSHITVAIKFSNFGVAVHVQSPPPDQIGQLILPVGCTSSPSS